MNQTSTTKQAARLSVSTWSLHRSLGRPPFHGPGKSVANPGVPTSHPQFSLVELPARIAEQGIHTLEICHFHLPSREPSYLRDLRSSIEDAGVELWSLLIDDGDITDPLHAERDVAWIKSWLDVAGALGAKNARVIAGKAQPTAETLAISQRHLAHLAPYARSKGVRLMTENWMDLTSTPEAVLTLLNGLPGELGLCADFGNWRGPNKYSDLAQIFPHADSCHSKAHFSAPGVLDEADYRRCLDLCHAAGFAGPHTLIYDGPGDDEFAGLKVESVIVAKYL